MSYRIIIQGKVRPDDPIEQTFLDTTLSVNGKGVWERAELNLDSLDGKPGQDFVDPIKEAVARMHQYPEYFQEAFDQGIVDKTRMFLMEILAGAYNHPTMPVRVLHS